MPATMCKHEPCGISFEASPTDARLATRAATIEPLALPTIALSAVHAAAPAPTAKSWRREEKGKKVSSEKHVTICNLLQRSSSAAVLTVTYQSFGCHCHAENAGKFFGKQTVIETNHYLLLILILSGKIGSFPFSLQDGAYNIEHTPRCKM